MLMNPNKNMASLIVAKMGKPEVESKEPTLDYAPALHDAARKIFAAIKTNDAEAFCRAYEDLHVIIDDKLEEKEEGDDYGMGA